MDTLFYGIKDGKEISIQDAKRGKACGCVCPACKGALVAKKGEIKIHHFAHLAGQNCKFGYETTLHLMAKDILSTTKQMMLPKSCDCKSYTGYSYIFEDCRLINVDKVELEEYQENVKPDVIVYSGDKKIYIEICVTHEIDNNKLNKLKENGIDTIEIKLLKEDGIIDKEKLTEVLLGDNKYKYWAYNKEKETKEKFFKDNCEIETVFHGCALHTVECPIKKRVWNGIVYANVIDDCTCCKYFYGDSENGILCLKKANVNDSNFVRKEYNPDDYESCRRKFGANVYKQNTINDSNQITNATIVRNEKVENKQDKEDNIEYYGEFYGTKIPVYRCKKCGEKLEILDSSTSNIKFICPNCGWIRNRF